MPANTGTIVKLKQISKFLANLDRDMRNLRKAVISLNMHIGQEERYKNLQKGISVKH